MDNGEITQAPPNAEFTFPLLPPNATLFRWRDIVTPFNDYMTLFGLEEFKNQLRFSICFPLQTCQYQNTLGTVPVPYNLYAYGPSGMGKRTLVKSFCRNMHIDLLVVRYCGNDAAQDDRDILAIYSRALAHRWHYGNPVIVLFEDGRWVPEFGTKELQYRNVQRWLRDEKRHAHHVWTIFTSNLHMRQLGKPEFFAYIDKSFLVPTLNSANRHLFFLQFLRNYRDEAVRRLATNHHHDNNNNNNDDDDDTTADRNTENDAQIAQHMSQLTNVMANHIELLTDASKGYTITEIQNFLGQSCEKMCQTFTREQLNRLPVGSLELLPNWSQFPHLFFYALDSETGLQIQMFDVNVRAKIYEDINGFRQPPPSAPPPPPPSQSSNAQQELTNGTNGGYHNIIDEYDSNASMVAALGMNTITR